MSSDLKGSILFGRWEIIESLGKGTVSEVYRAYDRVLGRYVAIKQLRPEITSDTEAVKRFEGELRTIGGLKHPHIVTLYDFRRDPESGDCFSIMEYVEEGSLRKYTEAEPLSVVQALDIVIDICDPLEVVHRQNIIHSDLKPDNILLDKGEAKVIPKICDFGTRTARTGYRTFLYASPEELRRDEVDSDSVDTRSDLYSLGTILYEMLTGTVPFPLADDDDLNAWLAMVLHEEPTPPSRKQAGISPSVDEVVLRALQKAPDDRYQTAREMARALKQAKRSQQEWEVKIKKLCKKAKHHLEQEEWQKAAKLYKEISEQNPADRDALEKLEIAENQQRLMSLRLQISQDVSDKLWEEARKLVEEALEIARDDETLTTWREKIDDQLTITGILRKAEEAVEEADWTEVIRLCLKALDLNPSHAEASSLFIRAQTQLKIATLHREAETLRQQEDKQGELETLEKLQKELQKVILTDKEVDTRIRELQEMIYLETCYAQGKQAYDEARWEAAMEALKKVVDIDKFYVDAAPMLLYARDQLAKELSGKHDDKRRQELQKLFDESEELIESKQWQAAQEALKKIGKDRLYRNVIARKELLTCLSYVAGHKCAEAEEWYQAKCCFAKVLEYTPDYRDAKKQLATAQNSNLLRRHYNIKRTLGSGGTSQVDYAEDMNRGQCEVSLKYLKASSAIHRDDISQRFRRQAQRCMALDHPNIVRILAIEMRSVVDAQGVNVDVPVVVMEYFEGQNLAEFLSKSRGIPEKQAIKFTRQLCLALQYAHERDILHLDIKPSNVLVQTDGLLKLTDFDLTSRGTRGYRSPEQARRSADVDERTDIFAAGKVLYALLTGKLPFEDPLDEEDSSFQEITPLLQAVICKATADNPADRYQFAHEMLEALQKAEADLPFWPEFCHRVSYAWQKTVEAVKTWKGVLAIIGVLLTFIVVPVLTAEDNTPLGRIRGRIVAHISGGNGETPVVISSTHTPSLTPVGTPSPTHIPTPIPSPTATSTSTWTSTPSPTATSTSTSTSTPSPTLTSTPYPAPALVSPDAGTSFPEGQDVKLVWEWEGDLVEKEFFEVRIRLEGEQEFDQITRTKISYEFVLASELTQARTYEWQVAIVSLSGREKSVSQIRSFEVQ